MHRGCLMVNKTGNQVYSNVGKATGKGIIDCFKDAGGLGKGFTKALGPLGAGLAITPITMMRRLMA